jgi:hypothetical protein
MNDVEWHDSFIQCRYVFYRVSDFLMGEPEDG